MVLVSSSLDLYRNQTLSPIMNFSSFLPKILQEHVAVTLKFSSSSLMVIITAKIWELNYTIKIILDCLLCTSYYVDNRNRVKWWWKILLNYYYISTKLQSLFILGFLEKIPKNCWKLGQRERAMYLFSCVICVYFLSCNILTKDTVVWFIH